MAQRVRPSRSGARGRRGRPARPAARDVAWRDVDLARLGRQHLVQRASPASLADVVADVCGIHAQVAAAAEFALAIRVDGITRRDVREALWERRALVKVPSLRTTLHIHSADDVALWMAARRISPYWLDERTLAPYGLTPATAAEILDAIEDALDGRCLTRDELGAAVAERLGPWVLEETEVISWGGRPTMRWPHLVTPAAYTGRLCFGPNRGNRTTFVRPAQWLGSWDDVDEHEAFLEALRRYLSTYGPARAVDFAHWFGVHRHRADHAFEAIRDELQEVELEGMGAFRLRRRGRAPRRGRSIRLAPEFDCYVIGAAPPGPARAHVVPEAAGKRIFDAGAGPRAALLVDGVVAGTWTRRRRGRALEITVEPLGRLAAGVQRAVRTEVERLASFLEGDVELTLRG